MSSSGGDSTQTIRYYSGIEDAYNKLRGIAWTQTQALYLTSPYTTGFDVVAPESAFFGIGYIVSDFPSLYDMFGKFMAGLDIEVLKAEIINELINGSVGSNLKTTNRINENYDTDTVVLPKWKASMQSMNAVMGSSFIDGLGTIYSNMLKRINTYNANIDMKLLDMGIGWAAKHLEWNTQVITQYSTIINNYLQSNANYISHKMQVTSADKLWPFRVMDQMRSIVGCLNGVAGAHSTQTSTFAQIVTGVVGTANFLASPTGNWLTNTLGITGATSALTSVGASTASIMGDAALASEAAGWEAFASDVATTAVAAL